MPTFERNGAQLYYETHGNGPPVLLLAPGGMRSSIEFWSRLPWNPVEALRGQFRVVAMDQRNAGRSTAPVRSTDGWTTYTEDQLGLMDHLGIDRFAVVGCCIGGSFIMGLLQQAPSRVTRAVAMQPIGHTPANRQIFFDLFDGWVDEVRPAQPEVPDEVWSGYRERMFGGDFVFNATREFVQSIDTPLLVLRGDDQFHPAETSEEVARLAPHATLVPRWREPDLVEQTATTVTEFLTEE